MKSVTITPKKLSGSVSIPPSKSLCHRAVICASLAKGISIINNIGNSEDIDKTIEAMKALGAQIKREDTRLIIDGSKTFSVLEPTALDCVKAALFCVLIPSAALQGPRHIYRQRSPWRAPLDLLPNF